VRGKGKKEGTRGSVLLPLSQMERDQGCRFLLRLCGNCILMVDGVITKEKKERRLLPSVGVKDGGIGIKGEWLADTRAVSLIKF